MSHDERAATMKHEDVVALLQERDHLQQQIEWFKKQLFGQKSERRVPDPDARQLALGEVLPSPVEATSTVTVAEHVRTKRPASEGDDEDLRALRFDESVPVEEIRVPHPALDAEHEIVSEKVSYRLAQRPAAYFVLKIVRPVIKRKSDGVIASPPIPGAVLGRSVADVSFLAGLAIEKFVYHLPLYRQHQRLEAAGIHLARSTLTGLVQRMADLLGPIAEAQRASILAGKLVAVDETPIKAGQGTPGKMKTGWFWPIYGDRGEVVFPFSETRSAAFLKSLLGEFRGTLVTDGYAAYQHYALEASGVVHAQCWSHTRRQFVQAEKVEPALTATALDYIRRLYAEEARLASKMAEPGKRLELRTLASKPIVDAFFAWLKATLTEQVLLPRNPFTEAAEYALSRERSLRVFLEDPDVPLDTNHLERAIRPIAVGRKNWLFCWTEIGARYVGVIQGLLSTCKLQGIDPYVYLVDVLQRVETHSVRDVGLLIPRLWKEHFAANPLRSPIDRAVNNAAP